MRCGSITKPIRLVYDLTGCQAQCDEKLCRRVVGRATFRVETTSSGGEASHFPGGNHVVGGWVGTVPVSKERLRRQIYEISFNRQCPAPDIFPLAYLFYVFLCKIDRYFRYSSYLCTRDSKESRLFVAQSLTRTGTSEEKKRAMLIIVEAVPSGAVFTIDD